MRILITGVSGFVGRHLLSHLSEQQVGCEIHGTVIANEAHFGDTRVIKHIVDLKDTVAVAEIVDRIQPDQVYHLAAMSSPRRSFEIPWETLENNIRAQLNIFLACLRLKARPKVLVVTSAEIYGPVKADQLPVREDSALCPTNPYGVSKVAQDMLALQYYMSHHLPTVRVRPFNHIGPGQSEGFVATDFAKQIARIEAGFQEPIIEVGNLSAERDFTDVRDVVRAYRLIMENGMAGSVFNVASGQAYSIHNLLEILLGYSSSKIKVHQEAARMMPIDVPVVRGDATRLNELTGWKPQISFETSLLDVLNDWRQRTK
ncbi:MAG: GDP-mannose 4,6-dehydratase [Anaerolineae bacterium]